MFYSLCVYFITFVISLLCTYGYQKVYDIEPKSETNVKYAIYKFIFFHGNSRSARFNRNIQRRYGRN